MEIQGKTLRKDFRSKVVFSDLSISIDVGQKIGLVGTNGVGKSTLLRILANQLEPDYGEVIYRTGITIGYLPQDFLDYASDTAEAILSGQAGRCPIINPHGAIKNCERNIKYKQDIVLSGLGISALKKAKQMGTLSAGEQTKVILTAIIIAEPDVYLLDEPTNNLDISAQLWLERYIQHYVKTAVIISHDRHFLDRIVNKIGEIDWARGCLEITNGKYSDYVARKKKAINRQIELYNLQQKEIFRLEDSIQRKKRQAAAGETYFRKDNDKLQRGYFQNRATKSSRSAKAMEKRIEHMEKIVLPIIKPQTDRNLNCSDAYGDYAISIQNAVMGYSNTGFALGPFSFTISRGARIALIGNNGSGKSTFIKSISIKLALLSGAIEYNSSLHMSELFQNYSDYDKDLSVSEYIESVLLDTTDKETTNTLFRFGIDGDMLRSKLRSLSPGERSRLQLSIFSLSRINMLLLDEPTNHIDLDGLEMIDAIMDSFQGTIVLASHDRTLLKKLRPTSVFLFANRGISLVDDLESYIKESEADVSRAIKLLGRF